MGFQDPSFDVLLGMDVLSGFHLNIYADQFIEPFAKLRSDGELLRIRG